MKSSSYLRLWALICALIFLLSGCFSQAPASGTSADLSPEERYLAAVSQRNAAKDLSFSIIYVKHTLYQGQQFSQITKQHSEYRNIGESDFTAAIDEIISVGEHTIQAEKRIGSDVMYLTVNDGFFRSDLADPAVYAPLPGSLESDLYTGIDSAQLYGRTVIAFSQPTAAEGWALPAGAAFIDAAGSAVVDAEGALKYVQYCLQYSIGTTQVIEAFYINWKETAKTTVQLPKDTSQYIAIASPDAPLLLEKACGYLLQADCISTTETTLLESQVSGISRSQTTQLRLSGEEDSLSAWIDTQITLTNSSRGGETTTVQQTELFQDGQYTVKIDGTEATPDDDITAESIHGYCEDLLVGSILMPCYITAAAITEQEDTLELSFQASDALASMICANASQTLYQDPSLLSSLSASYTTQEMSCCLQIDAQLGIPVACGIRYSGTHDIEGAAYSITSQTDQRFALIESVFE